MAFPKLTARNTSREFIDVFSGYVHKLKIKDGEFYETKNLSNYKYPLFSTRPLRGLMPSERTAPAYSTSSTYEVGDYVKYDSKIWQCTTAIATAEAWTAAHWTQATNKMFVNLQAIIAKDAVYHVDNGVL